MRHVTPPMFSHGKFCREKGVRPLLLSGLLALGITLSLFLTWGPVRAQAPCQIVGDLWLVDTPISGTGAWSSSDCRSDWTNREYTDRWEFRVFAAGRVVIDLTSDTVDTWLSLFDATGDLLDDDDDGGTGINSRITVSLDAGTYYIEASTYYSRRTGAYELRIGSSNADCDRIALSVPHNGRETLSSSDCRDPYDPDDYADIYSFRLDVETRVTIDLESTNFDAFVRLLDERGGAIEWDDDSGSGLNSRLERMFQPGAYQIVVTDANTGRGTGSYELRVNTDGAHSTVCVVADIRVPHEGRDTLSSSDCRDPYDTDDYADIYSFRLDVESNVTIDMTTRNFDAFARLLDGYGVQIEFDNDDGPGENSRIERMLSAGTYQIVATDASRGRGIGSYDLSVDVEGLVSSCPSTDLGTIDRRVTVVGARWSERDCVSSRPETSGSYVDRYTFRVASAGAVQVVLLSGSGETWIWLADRSGNNHFDSGMPVNVADAPKGTVITSGWLTPGVDYVVSATMPAGRNRESDYSLQIVPTSEPARPNELAMKNEIAEALLSRRQGDGSWAPVNSQAPVDWQGLVESRRGVNVSYNDWGCPFVGECQGVERPYTLPWYPTTAFPLYRPEGACNDYIGGHGGWDVQTRDAVGGRKPPVRFRSLTSGVLTKAGSDEWNTIAVYDGINTTIYLHGGSEVGTTLRDKRVGDLVHVGDVLGAQSDVGSSGATHIHVELREGQHSRYSCGADQAPPPRGSQLRADERSIYPISYLYDAIQEVLRVAE